MRGRRRWLAAIALLFIIAAAASPALAFRENQFELRSGNLLYQSQFYTTSPAQKLFHSQTAAGTDEEAFAFSPLSDGGIALAQADSGTTAATDTGFYTAVFSFIKFNCPTGEGFLHTSINDPIVSKTPVFNGLSFPSMTRMSGPASKASAPSASVPAMAAPVQQTAYQAGKGPDQVISASLFKKALSSDVGVADATNSPFSSPASTSPRASSSVGISANVNALGKNPAAATTVALTSNTGARPGSGASLLSKPLSKQANKPFTETLTPLVDPRKACRDDVAGMSGWNRLTANALGRITIDSTYAGTTSSPTYMNPYNIIKLSDQVKVSSDAMNMTQPGSYLQQRLWAL